MDFMAFFMVPLWTLMLRLGSVRGSFVVDVTQSSYQAEENHNITLEWTFTTKPDTSISALKILCSLNNDLTLYYLRDGVEFSEVQDKKFSGRVQSDKDALREGRIRLQLSRLRTEDSGLYLCEVDTGYGSGYNSCRLTVSDAKFAKTSTTTLLLFPTPDPEDMTQRHAGRSWVPVVIVVITVPLVLALAGFAAYFSPRLAET
ncbi:programmed cell death 1 ligand 1-like isoform X1 [Maylandia zebra]|uniref:programmed cell death 1 ligand 1-like isoform X1 n=1 Tax=Maylandia zebra TaxID=106582 RepID=UPI00403C1010